MNGPKNQKAVSVRMHTLRRARGMSQAELAEAAGLVGSSISLMERGALAITWSRLGSLAEALQVPIRELVDDGKTGDFIDAIWMCMAATLSTGEQGRNAAARLIHELKEEDLVITHQHVCGQPIGLCGVCEGNRCYYCWPKTNACEGKTSHG